MDTKGWGLRIFVACHSVWCISYELGLVHVCASACYYVRTRERLGAITSFASWRRRQWSFGILAAARASDVTGHLLQWRWENRESTLKLDKEYPVTVTLCEKIRKNVRIVYICVLYKEYVCVYVYLRLR